MTKRKMNTILVSAVTALLLVTASAFAGLLASPEEVKSIAGNPDVKIVDVRYKADAYGKGHIPGALQVNCRVDLEDYTRYTPNKYPQLDQFLDVMARLGIDNDDTIIAYDDMYGIFASRFLFIMELYGHDPEKLKLLNGGIGQWQKENYEVTTEPTVAASTQPYKTSGPNNNLLVTWNDVLHDAVEKQDNSVVLHDTRPEAEFRGENIRAIRGGNIPNSINVPGSSAANDKETQLFKPVDQILETFTVAGITPDKTIYTYCHSSYRAAQTYLVLTRMLGYKDVKIYDGAWMEWAVLTALPSENTSWLAAMNK